MDPYEVFSSLGPVAVYRHPDAVKEKWANVQAAQQELKRRFDDCRTDRQRLLLTVEVAGHLIGVARQRACNCQLQAPDLSCENLDIDGLAADWVEFVRQRAEERSGSSGSAIRGI